MTGPGGQPLPIEAYGLVGDTRTAALVADDGSIDWLCLPSFDGEPVFARLVAGPAGGVFRLGPSGPSTVVGRRYRPDSATLETTWDCAGGRLTLTDAMVAEIAGHLRPTTLLVRRLRAVGGPIEVALEFDPRFGDTRRPPRARRRGEVLVCTWRSIALSVHAAPYVPIEPGRPHTIVVTPDQPLTVALCVVDGEPLVHVPPDAAWRALHHDERFWHRWCAEITRDVPFRDAVVRSLLTLRLLTYSPTGAPVAAPPPPPPGGPRGGRHRGDP
ncbi:MAG: glycoside hydrolase family 15 protein, partial [Micromonosporaceae bacterium]|nr:glycoside hydrolase family 15 protein [Micromonosporaceae bacterium]